MHLAMHILSLQSRSLTASLSIVSGDNVLRHRVTELSGSVCSASCGLSESDSPSSSNVSSNWNFSLVEAPMAPCESCSSGGGEGLWRIMLWYHSRLSSRVSRMSCASGWTRSAHVSQRGCTMQSMKPTFTWRQTVIRHLAKTLQITQSKTFVLISVQYQKIFSDLVNYQYQ